MRWPQTTPMLIAAAVTVLVSGCDEPVPEGGIGGECGAESLHTVGEAYFNETMVPIFDTYCSYCHGSDKEGETARHGATPRPASNAMPRYTPMRMAEGTRMVVRKSSFAASGP